MSTAPTRNNGYLFVAHLSGIYSKHHAVALQANRIGVEGGQSLQHLLDRTLWMIDELFHTGLLGCRSIPALVHQEGEHARVRSTNRHGRIIFDREH
jgi:hypothetical protein